MSTEPTPQPPADPWLGAFAALPQQPQPSTPPPGWTGSGTVPIPSKPPRSRTAPWIGVGLALAGLVTASSVLGAPPAPAATGVARWLPPDGTRLAFAWPQGTHTVEWSRPTAFSLKPSSSRTFDTWSGQTSTDWLHAAYLRVSAQQLSDQGEVEEAGEELWLIDTSGARTIAESNSEAGDTIWEPGLLDLPASATVDMTWESAGKVSFRPVGGEWTTAEYRASHQATAPADPAEQAKGCLSVATIVTINQQEIRRARTWCPGAGTVTFDTGDAWPSTDTVPPRHVSEQPAFDWGQADRLELTFATHDLFLSTTSPPGLLPDGSLLAVKQTAPDLVSIDPAANPPTIRWNTRPGGVLTSITTVADISLATTSRRELVAYGPDGQWLWESGLSELTTVPPVPLGADAVVVVTLDGEVAAYDLTTGDERWRTSMGSEIRLAPLVAGDRVVVADASGRLSCFDAEGNEVWRVDSGRVSALAVSAGAEPVIAVGRSDAYLVQGHSLANGSQVWRRRILEDIRTVMSLGDRFVLRDDDRLIGIDATSGTPLWSEPVHSLAGVGGGSHLLLLAESTLTLVDTNGRVVRSWPHQFGNVSSSVVSLTVTGGALLAFGPAGWAIGRTP